MRCYTIRLAAFTLTLFAGLVVGTGQPDLNATLDGKRPVSTPGLHVAGVGKTCEIHGELLSVEYVSILAELPGHPASDAGYLAARERLFPNSNSFILDNRRSVTEGHAKVSVCADCRAVERRWIKSRKAE